MKSAIYRIPRVLAIFFLCFLFLFSLDVIGPEYSTWEILQGMFIHNIPVLVLAVVLGIAWKRELVGAIGFTIAALAYIITLLFTRSLPRYTVLSWSAIIAGPALLVAILFFIGRRQKKSS